MTLRIRSSSLSLTVMLLAAFLVAACGGSGDDVAQTSPPAQEPPADGAVGPNAVPGDDGRDTELSEPDPGRGAPLTEPQRYYGLYANPESPDRQWFVTEARRSKYAEQAPEVPPGYLMIGALFGDVAPWQMKTLSQTRFEQFWVSDSQTEAYAVEFELDEDGHAVAMTFTDAQNAPQGRLERQGELPANLE